MQRDKNSQIKTKICIWSVYYQQYQKTYYEIKVAQNQFTSA